MRWRDVFSWDRIALAAIVLLALALRYEGVQRPLTMHPDEPKINVWMRSAREPGWLKDETYPGGFFVMAEASRRLWELLANGTPVVEVADLPRAATAAGGAAD